MQQKHFRIWKVAYALISGLENHGIGDPHWKFRPSCIQGVSTKTIDFMMLPAGEEMAWPEHPHPQSLSTPQPNSIPAQGTPQHSQPSAQVSTPDVTKVIQWVQHDKTLTNMVPHIWSLSQHLSNCAPQNTNIRQNNQ